jgi:hypothetical protein
MRDAAMESSEEEQKMKYRTAISIIVAAMLALTSMSVYANQGKGGGASNPDQQMDRDRDQDRLHTQDPMSLGDRDIYGSEVMTEDELSQYRKQLANMKTEQDREQFQIQHQKQMQDRVMKQGKDIVPPGQGPIYGGELMSVEERNQYREQLQQMDSDQERTQFQAQHREKMEARAKALEREVEEAE